MLRREIIKRLLDCAAQLVAEGAFLGIACGAARLRAAYKRRNAGTPSQPQQGLVRGDLGNSCGERRRPGKAGEVCIGANPGFLGYVLGLSIVPYDGTRDTIYACVVAAQKKLERLRVAGDDFLVGATGSDGLGIVHASGGNGMP